MSSALLDSFIVAVDGIVIVIVITGSGAILTRYKVISKQFLDIQGAKILSQLSVNLLIPCLLFGDMIRNLNIENLQAFGLIWLLSTIHIIVGCLLGWLFGKLTKAPRNQLRLMMTCVGFQDTTAIPLVYATVLGDNSVTSSASDFTDDATDYVLIYSVFIIVYKWTIAYKIMEPENMIQTDQEVNSVVSLQTLNSNGEKNPSLVKKGGSQLTFWQQVKKIMNPPIYASLVAIPLALIPYISEYVISGSGSVLGKNVFQAIVIVGSAASPLIDIVLGCNLSQGYPPTADITWLRLILILIGKLFLMPILGLVLLVAMYDADLINATFAIMLLVIYAGPTSLQVLMICTDHQNQVENVSKMYTVMYLSSAIPLTFWTVLGLEIFF